MISDISAGRELVGEDSETRTVLPYTLMRPGRQVQHPRKLPRHEKCFPLVFQAAAVLLMVMSCHSSIQAQDRREDAADKALSSVRTWHALRRWFEQFKKCDDGYPAEGVSEGSELL